MHQASKRVESRTKALKKQSDELENLVISTTAQLKGFGDLQNWAEVVWRDIYVLEEVFDIMDAESIPGSFIFEAERLTAMTS